MPFCPKCRDEFQDWVKICPDCGVDLVNELEPLPAPTTNFEGLVTVATFSHPEEAHIASARLESDGIWSFVADEHMITANWLYSIAIGGVRVQVRESDAAEAIQILRVVPENPQYIPNIEEVCPKCASADIRYETFSLRPMFVSWLLSYLIVGVSIILPSFKRKWTCKNCGHQWRDRN